MAIPTARLEARISTDLHALLRRAAELQGRTVTDFVADSLRVAAYKALDEATMTRLSREDQVRFVELLLNPPPPNAALKRAFARRKKLFTNP
ncbi:type II toxin-antitoxin system TacA family antitoxin [Mesoterricola silvestris]|uniref:DUF1778 domain-containing protein n=1 Tax=Mesoterricola silvestris TaxID=2927979 RepID=A0AA48K7N0_9BACT|nr:DUF1778 domain-containing protein [Mesoterricola silvestris]BDU71316.1 hypothetical protein METEAL_04900 [Mesoterricola silvestris]